MSGSCPDADQLAVLVARPAGDPFWDHAGTCPDCRARLQAYRRFLSPEEGGEDLEFDLEEADRELADRLAAALGRPEDVQGRRSWWRAPRSLYALAAVLLVGVGLFVAPELTGPRRFELPVMDRALRGAGPADGMFIIAAEGDRWRISWPVHPEADQVVVVFFDQAMVEVGLAAAEAPDGLTTTRADAGPDAAFAQIVYLARGDTLARGPLLQAPLPGR